MPAAPARIVAKIEDQSAIANLDDIIRATDVLMIARGDLGIEVPMEDLPLIQKEAVDACIRLRKPVIVATHLLESMITSPMPTRAEVGDIAGAVWSMADSIMLSGETTTGRYPLECVQVMKRVAGKVEASADKGYNETLPLKSAKDHLLCAAVVLGATTRRRRASWSSPATASCRRRCRPCARRAAPFTPLPTIAQVFRGAWCSQWGVEPFLMEFSGQPEQTILDSFEHLLRRGWVEARRLDGGGDQRPGGRQNHRHHPDASGGVAASRLALARTFHGNIRASGRSARPA